MGNDPTDIRLARLDGASEQVDRRLSAVEGRLGGLDRKIDAVFFRLVPLMLGTWVTLMLAVLFGHQ